MNIKTKRLLKQYKNPRGYCEVNLWSNGKGATKQVHQIVYTSFHNKTISKGYVINHIDGNKEHNSIQNLEEVTYQNNNIHAVYIIKTNNTAKPVIQLSLDGNKVNEFPSMAEARRQTGIANISRAIKHNTTAGGYKWRFNN